MTYKPYNPLSSHVCRLDSISVVSYSVISFCAQYPWSLFFDTSHFFALVAFFWCPYFIRFQNSLVCYFPQKKTMCPTVATMLEYVFIGVITFNLIFILRDTILSLAESRAVVTLSRVE